MGLSAEQKKQLAELQRLEKEPDTPAPNVTFNLDLSSDAAWERAAKLGIIPSEDDGDEDEDGDSDGDGEEAPRRRGYFG